MSACEIFQGETTCGDIVVITDEAITVSGEGEEREVETEGRRGEGRRKGGRGGRGGSLGREGGDVHLMSVLQVGLQV